MRFTLNLGGKPRAYASKMPGFLFSSYQVLANDAPLLIPMDQYAYLAFRTFDYAEQVKSYSDDQSNMGDSTSRVDASAGPGAADTSAGAASSHTQEEPRPAVVHLRRLQASKPATCPRREATTWRAQHLHVLFSSNLNSGTGHTGVLITRTASRTAVLFLSIVKPPRFNPPPHCERPVCLSVSRVLPGKLCCEELSEREEQRAILSNNGGSARPSRRPHATAARGICLPSGCRAATWEQRQLLAQRDPRRDVARACMGCQPCAPGLGLVCRNPLAPRRV